MEALNDVQIENEISGSSEQEEVKTEKEFEEEEKSPTLYLFDKHKDIPEISKMIDNK